MNARECVRLALTCQQPDRIPRALGFFHQSVAEVTPSDTDEYFNLDLRFIEFNPPEGQSDFLHYLRNLPQDIYVGSLPQLQTYHEWDYFPEKGGLTINDLVMYGCPIQPETDHCAHSETFKTVYNFKFMCHIM